MHDAIAFVSAERGGRRRLRALYPLISADAPTTWIHVAHEGTWKGHGNGEFSFTRDVFEQVIANFERNPNPVPLDYEHATEVAIPAPAAGWVHRIEARTGADGRAQLWALVELSTTAAAYIRAGRYRFSSGVFDFEAIDPQSGDAIGVEMPSLALTNVPFIRGQNPIQLSRRRALAKGAVMNGVDKAELISRLRKLDGDTVTPEQAGKLTAALAMLADAIGGGEEASEEDKPREEKEEPAAEAKAALAAAPSLSAVPAAAAPSAALPEGVGYPEGDPATGGDAGGLVEQIMQATGMDMAALIEALKQMMAGGMPTAPAPLSQGAFRSALSMRDETISVLAKELSAYREKDADEAIELLVARGYALDDSRATFRKLYLSDRKAYDAITATLPPVVPVGKHATAHAPPTVDVPAIDEDDPQVKSLRRSFENTRLANNRAAQDKAISAALAARKGNGARI